MRLSKGFYNTESQVQEKGDLDVADGVVMVCMRVPLHTGMGMGMRVCVRVFNRLHSSLIVSRFCRTGNCATDGGSPETGQVSEIRQAWSPGA